MFTPQQENAVDGEVKEDEPVMTGADTLKTATVVNHTPSLSEPQGNEPPELLTNEILVDKGRGKLETMVRWDHTSHNANQHVYVPTHE